MERVAGFTLSGDTLTANNFLLDAGNQKMTLGSGNEIFIADGDVGINLGNSLLLHRHLVLLRLVC